jgi:F-type H+-transporting ATPase subunit a
LLLSALKFPPIGELVEWKGILFKGSVLEVNKVVLLMWAAVIIVMAMFWTAGRRASSGQLVPVGVQSIVEMGIDFVRNDIILQTMGPEGLFWTPFLVTMFFFVFFTNISEVIPFIQFPVNARMALPAFLGIMVWVIYNFVGIKAQGFGGYMKSVLFPPGVPKALLVLVTPIEFISTIIVRPFTLAVRLFANMLAGHILILTFIGLMFILEAVYLAPLVLPVATVFYLFEVIIVVGIQAFIFAALSAIYIGSAIEPEH